MNFRISFLLCLSIFFHFYVNLVQPTRTSVGINTSKIMTHRKVERQITQMKRSSRASNQMFPGYQSLLEKIQNGHKLTMVALGGSNTAGGGLSMNDKRYFELVADWWNNNVYKSTKSRMNAYSMAITGTGSDFFTFCFQNFLENKTNPDIVMLEFAINDSGDEHGKAAQPMEVLTRRLLLLPTNTVVIYVNLVNPDMLTGRVTNRKCSNMQDMGFDELAKHYRIPSFSMRDIVCPLTNGKRVLDESKSDMFANDGSHTSSAGHMKIASMIIKYLKTSIFNKPGNVPGNLEKVPSLPKPLFTDRSINDNELNKPLCWSHMTSNWKLPLRQTLNVQVIKSYGFKYRSPKQARWVGTIRTDAPSGWEAGPGPIAFTGKFTIPPDTSPRSLSVVFQIRNEKPLSIKIYLNDEQKSCIQMVIKKNSDSDVTQTRVFSIAKRLSPGTYDLNIEGEVNWLDMVAIVAGYPGYHGYKGYKTFEGTITRC